MKTLYRNSLIFGLVVILSCSLSTAEEESELSSPVEIYEPLPVPLPLTSQQVLRRKRDITSDILDAAGSLGIGSGFIKKFRNLVDGVPPKMQDALLSQDFSNVTAEDMRNLNISVLEYIPPNIISKLNISLLTPVVERLLQANKPMALGRVMGAMGDKMDSNQLLDTLKDKGGLSDSNEEAANVMLYTALNKVGDKGGINQAMIRRLATEGLLSLVPEEQLMKVTEPNAAKNLLNRLYQKPQGDTSDLTDVDDQALVYKLAETGYGKAEDWSSDTIRSIGSKVMALMPAQFIEKLNPNVVASSIGSLRDTKFESTLQAKAVTDAYLENSGINNQEATASGPGGGNLGGLLGALGPLAAFVNPSLSKDTNILNSIVDACDKLNLPAPLKAVSGLLKQKVHSGRKISDLGYDDIKDMGGAVLKNGPPSLINQAIQSSALSENELQDIAGEKRGDGQGPSSGLFSNPFFQGIISQVAAYAVKYFTQAGKINFSDLPGAFLGALGIKGIADMSNRDLNDDVLDKLKNNPDALDDAQKAMLLKRLKDAGMLDTNDIPPEIRALQPRKKADDPRPRNDILKGLPSENELRLAHGEGKMVTASDLENDRYLIGVLTPKQVEAMNLEDMPAVLSVVRKSKDGPQQQTLEALHKRFVQYIRLKSEDYDSPDKKLLKYISAAEVSKLPATVLAYFIDPRQTAKLPNDVRKEIMIAMGELSTKDHASIPGKTREEIILQGLAAIDSMTGVKKLDVPELAAIGTGVADLPADKVAKLTPVAVEQALEIIKGTADDDDDGLHQRACLKKDQKKAWRDRIIELYGQPSKWEPATVTALCCAIGLLDEDDIVSIEPDALATCRCASDAPPPSHLVELKKGLDANCKYELGESDNTKKTMEKVKSEIAFDLDDLESQIITGRRRKRSDDSKLTCFKVRVTGTATPFSKEQLESLPLAEIKDCIYELGLEQLPLENSRILWKKLVASKEGGVSALNADDYRFAGHVLSGITLSDVTSLDFTNWDIVFPFGKSLGLSKNVLEKLAAKLGDEQKKAVDQFTSNDLVVIRNILCGFSPESLSEIKSNAFRDALPVLKSLDPSCEQTRLAALAGITMRPEIYGDASKWTAADVRGVGILLVGLPTRVIESIPPDAFIGVSGTVAGALPENILETLNADQVAHIPRFSAQSMSEDQKSFVNDEAKEKLDALIRGPLVSHAILIHQQMFSCWTFITLITTALFAHRIL